MSLLRRRARRPAHVLVLVQNAPIERDSRVRHLSVALAGGGIPTTVICPSSGLDRELVIDGVVIRRFPPAPERPGVLGFVIEYTWSVAAIAALVVRTMWSAPVAVVHLCNPPDVLFIAALPCKLGGARLVFDHHDPAPEMFETRFGRRGPLHRLLLGAERATFRIVDHIVSTNESLAGIAVARGGRDPHDVTVVRNAPDLSTDQAASLDGGRDDGIRRILWIGHMGPDDGVATAIEAAGELIHRGRYDVRLILVGDGEVRSELEMQARTAGLSDAVEWTGWLPPEEVHRQLAVADVAVVPDPTSPRAELSTMIKVMEYMTFGVPVVAFPLRETQVSAGDAALFVDETPAALADGICAVLDDADLARRLSAAGTRRMAGELSWSAQVETYLTLIRRLLAGHPFDQR